MNAQDLKNSILQLAIKGKLVEQREEEGTAEELCHQIQDEKQRLINEGTIKKQKKLSEITEDEIPFDIPDTWKWARLGEVTHNWGQKKPDKTFDYIDVASIDNVKGILSEEKNLIEPKDAPSRARKIVKENTVLFSTVRPYLLNICVVNRKFKFEPITSTAFSVLHPFNRLDSMYLFYLLRSPAFVNYVNEKMAGVAYPAINDKNLLNGTIPIPPYEEQKRIVAKIEELMPYVDRYGAAYEKVTELNKKFPLEMEKSILQYAIQGKLVEQNEEEGTAEELYQQIQEEKQKLIDEGTIKKQKKLPEITEEEIPFDIPETWKWVRLGEVIDLLSGQDMPSNTYNDREIGIPYITGASNLENSQVIISRWIETPRSVAKKGHLLLTCKGTIGKTAILDIEEAHIARQIMSINPLENDAEYINVFIKSYVNELKRQAKSMIPGISRSVILEALIPLPPFKEQQRIVSKIEELLDYTKNLVKED